MSFDERLMKRLLVTLVLSALAVGAWLLIQFAQGATKSTWPVHVTVTCADETTRLEIESYIKRELRQIQDVALLQDPNGQDSYWSLRLVAFPSQNQQGRRLGYVLSSVCGFQLSERGARALVSFKGMPSDERDRIIDLLQGLRVIDHQAHLSDSNSLKLTCQKIVAAFDAAVLETARTTAVPLNPPPK